MKIKIRPNTVSQEEIHDKLSMNFPDYDVVKKSKRVLIVRRNKIAGCDVILRKKSIYVLRNFPSRGSKILFILSMFLLGIIIPLLVYYIAFHRKQKRVEKEVGRFLQETLNE
ncbi:MAG: hypothetical protein U9N51_04045 [Bacteroidota bacterium]|nr:hypothetical protein [Bacteroidota bacterium]